GSGDQRRLLTVSSVILILGGMVVDFTKNLVTGGATLAADLGTKAPVFGILQFWMFWPNLWTALTVFYDGLLGNAGLLGLGCLSFAAIEVWAWGARMLSDWFACTSVV